MHQDMLRDTLEMVPVALVLAVVLGFGARPARPGANAALSAEPAGSSALSLQSAAAALSAGTVLRDRSSSTLPRADTTHGEDRRHADDLASPRFLPRRSFDPSVPYFTTEDVLGQARTARPAVPGGAPGDGVKPATTPSPEGGQSLHRVDINNAGVADLTRIPSIGGMRARVLIESRPRMGYRSWAEIDRLPGFGPGTLDMLRRHGALEPARTH